MERKEIYRRQQAYEQELTAYTGDDPLNVRYEFITWLDGNYGKENVMDIFFPTLEDTLKCFWNVVQYQQDSRFIQLLVTYITMQTNPTEMYKSVYEKGTGIESPLFYSSWADAYVKGENFKKADEIFNLGLTKVKVKSELEYSYKEFLVSLGKKFLQRIDSDNVQTVCPKCSCSSQKNKTNSSHTSSNKDDVFEWALNPLKVGEPDNFKCPLVVPDPPDSNKIPMYPKSQVYVGDKEYSLEEIMAIYYQEKLKQKEAKNSTKNELDKIEIKGDVVLKQNLQMEVDENQECIKKIAGQENANLHIPEDVVHNHITPQKNSAPFPKPLLLHDSLHISQTSYTAHMKEAMNVVQEMWSSPTPPVSTTVNTRSRTLFKNNAAEPPPKDSQINNEDCGVAQIPSRSNHFAIYTEEDDQDENCMPTPQGCAIRPDKPKAVTSLKKDTLQMRKHSGKGNVLSERKPKGSIEKSDLEKRPSTNKKQLPFSTAIAEEDKRSEMLAMKLGDISIANPPMQPNRVTNIKPLLPVDPEDNISDETCNTKAFNFSLPSSTPIQNKKCHSTRVSVESQGIVEEQIIKSKNPGDLSMILEASKERYSNSSSSNGCALRGQSTALQSDIASKGIVYEQDIDPFCPKLLERLLNSINFPQSHHAENYFVSNNSLPQIAKSLQLGNEVYTVAGDIGKGAYARIVKATVKNRMCALKVEKPACKWELYICREIQKRVAASAKTCFMDVKNAYIFNGGSILETEWAQYGTLLNVSNQYKIATGKLLDTPIILHIAIELIDIIDYLHQCNIIHGDIKPDNFVVRSLPSLKETRTCIQLIDFGRSIDMRLLPIGTQFTTVVKTEGFTCCEMKDRRPWTYQTDLFGLLSTVHCLIVGEYMTVEKKDNEWRLHKQLPRTVRKLWDPIFSSLLNIESSDKLPSLVAIKAVLQEALNSKDKFLLTQNYRTLENIFKGK
ncbi:mitotic checkpoint serine/threonine-protein kinase BUB1-like isoform X3 [Rhodnius prolixus]|uniref:mitotic checkpoint serine/threonine-protein kinase BUB1-like isoform X3 n=1 Tax=Rhodnius prolixus TaxID=13249 RepID=UPI003D188F58